VSLSQHAVALLKAWVADASPPERDLRAAMAATIRAIGLLGSDHPAFALKGGVALALLTNHRRHTTDVDFSTTGPAIVDLSDFEGALRRALADAVEELDLGVDARVHGIVRKPPKRPDASFVTLEARIGYARFGAQEHRRLIDLHSPHVVTADLSFNEPIVWTTNVPGPDGILTYSLPAIAAEKLRALLQQIPRNRHRHKDVFDLAVLIRRGLLRDDDARILQAHRMMCAARDISPHRDALDNAVRARAAERWAAEVIPTVGEAPPDFDDCWQLVVEAYRSLPW
jgi:predicted nucleotidyltransferase component of viral defense system